MNYLHFLNMRIIQGKLIILDNGYPKSILYAMIGNQTVNVKSGGRSNQLAWLRKENHERILTAVLES